MRIVVIGSGPAGYVCALKSSQLGAEVFVVEDKEIGGTCLNWGCIPTKTISACTSILHKVRNVEDFGLEIRGEVVVNLSKIMERKDKVVSTMVKGIRSLFKSANVNVIEGKGSLKSSREVLVTKKDGSQETIVTDKIIIATGSSPAKIPILPFDGHFIISSTDALSITNIPQRLIIIGAGVIGCEFACIFRELGSEVTILEMMPRPVQTEDEEISDILEKELKKKKIKLMTSVKVLKATIDDKEVIVSLEGGKEIRADKVLVSIGRAYNVEGLGLENIGIERGPRGEIRVNSKMETNVNGIYAIGDVTGGILLAHVASKEGIVAAYNACGEEREMDYSVVPAAMFTSPEIGSVGLREHQCIEKGIKVNIGRFQFRALGKAHAIGEITGMVKIIADAHTDKVLGVHIIGPHASDLVHEGALAIQKQLTARDLANMIHAHPTLSEAIMEAAEDVHGDAIHIPSKNK